MTVDTEWFDRDLDRQLERLGEHREQRAAFESSGPVHEHVRWNRNRFSLVAVAAAALILITSGVYLAAQAGPDDGAVDAVGQADVVPASDPLESLGRQRPSEESQPEADAVPAVDDAEHVDGAVAETTTSSVAPTTTSASGTKIDEPSDAHPALPNVEAAGAALSETSTAMVELTTGLANWGATTAEDSTDLDWPDVAADAGDDQAECATTRLNADLSISISFADCLAADGRPLNGVIVASVKRWVPFELGVLIGEMTIGDDRLWLDATITFPEVSEGGAVEPVLSGEILTESPEAITHVEGTVHFRTDHTVFNGQLGYVTESQVIGGDRVIYRPGQIVVPATFVDVVVTEGSCAPSSGTADFQVFTVAGISGGGTETTDVEKVDLTEHVLAGVTYRSTTPVDGRVDLRLGERSTDHQLLAPCP